MVKNVHKFQQSFHLIFFGPRCSSAHVDAAVVTDVAWSVHLSVTIVSPAKTAESIEMPSGLWIPVAQGTMYCTGVQIFPCEGAILRGKGATHCKL